VFGAAVYNGFLALTQLPQNMATLVGDAGLNPWTVLALVLVVYLIFGCVMDSLSMVAFPSITLFMVRLLY